MQYKNVIDFLQKYYNIKKKITKLILYLNKNKFKYLNYKK